MSLQRKQTHGPFLTSATSGNAGLAMVDTSDLVCSRFAGRAQRSETRLLKSVRWPYHPSNFRARWPCRVIEGRVVGWERLEGGDGRDRDDGGRDRGRLGRALTAAEQEAARRFGSSCGDRLGRA